MRWEGGGIKIEGWKEEEAFWAVPGHWDKDTLFYLGLESIVFGKVLRGMGIGAGDGWVGWRVRAASRTKKKVRVRNFS